MTPATATDHLSSAIGKACFLKSRRLRLNAAKRCERGSAGARPHGCSQIRIALNNQVKMTTRTEIEVEFPLICDCARKLAKQPLGDSRLGRVERSHRDFKNREAEDQPQRL
jgi:hypothetical protein